MLFRTLLTILPIFMILSFTLFTFMPSIHKKSGPCTKLSRFSFFSSYSMFQSLSLYVLRHMLGFVQERRKVFLNTHSRIHFREDIVGLDAANGYDSGTSVGWGWRCFSSHGRYESAITILCLFHEVTGGCRRLWPHFWRIHWHQHWHQFVDSGKEGGQWHAACIKMNGCDHF